METIQVRFTFANYTKFLGPNLPAMSSGLDSNIDKTLHLYDKLYSAQKLP